ncbi:MAG: DUF1330 domain-containing protein [Flavobacteriaceae bacterium]|nr:MAG: DUF1330 domain-containing protein [Flavobacteriaceae bacterium]
MLTTQIHPTDAQLNQLKTYPVNKPITMLNILRFKKLTTTNKTGQEAYARYFKNAAPFVAKAKAKLIWKGNVHTSVIGDLDNQPHLVFLVEYPSVASFFEMVSNPEYQKVATNRSIALEYGGLIACETVH